MHIWHLQARVHSRGQNKFNLFQPALAELVQRLTAGVSRDAQCRALYPPISGLQEVSDPKKLIVFYVGGVAYKEARVAWEAATRSSGSSRIDVIVGGTTVHIMDSFAQCELLGEE
jgi:hypothetical protein